MHSIERTKIFVNRFHFASVRSDLLLDFRQANGIINFQPWLRKTVHEEFGIMLSDKESIAQLDEVVVSRYYDNIGDWLQEYMRRDLLSKGGGGR